MVTPEAIKQRLLEAARAGQVREVLQAVESIFADVQDECERLDRRFPDNSWAIMVAIRLWLDGDLCPYIDNPSVRTGGRV